MEEVSLAKRVTWIVLTLVVMFLNLVPMFVVIAYQVITKGKSVFETKERKSPPKILTDPKWGRHQKIFLPRQGINLHYVEKGDRKKPLMLCLHGFPECWFSFRETLVEFSDKYWVVAVDMRGYGESDKPADSRCYQRHNLTDDIKELVDLLGKEECVLVAHDWGGAIGWMVVNKYPETFTKHISLNGPHINAMMDHYFSSVSQMRKSWYTTFFQIPYLPEMLISLQDFELLSILFQQDIKFGKKLTNEELEVYKYYFSQKGSLSPAFDYYRNVNLDQREMRCDKTDNLIIWGQMDVALDVDIVAHTFKYADNLKAVFIPESGHFVLQEFPEKVHQHMREFLNK